MCPYLDGATGIPASLQRIAGEINSFSQPAIGAYEFAKFCVLSVSRGGEVLKRERAPIRSRMHVIGPENDSAVLSLQATCRVASTPERERRICRPGWMATTCWMTTKMWPQSKARLRHLLTPAGGRTCLSRFFFAAGRHLQLTLSSISIGV